MMRSMCPSCGALFETETSVIPDHSPAPPTREVCAGSGQHARNPDTDRRPLWNGLPNPHLAPPQWPTGPATTTTTARPSARARSETIDGIEVVPIPFTEEILKPFCGGYDTDGVFKSADQLSYLKPGAALSNLADELGTRVVVKSRLHNADIVGRILEIKDGFPPLIMPPVVECGACGQPLDRKLNGEIIAVLGDGGGHLCLQCVYGKSREGVTRVERVKYPDTKIHPMGRCVFCSQELELAEGGIVPHHFTPTKFVNGFAVHCGCPGGNRPPKVSEGKADTRRVECSACGHQLNRYMDGTPCGTADGAGGYTCFACTPPPVFPTAIVTDKKS